MAYDNGLYELLKDDLGDRPDMSEKKMFGGIAFMLNGNMLCGVHKNGAMYRVGKTHEAKALSLPGARKMDFTGRPMGGFIDAGEEAMSDDGTRAELLRLSIDFVTTLPAK
ncbi:TfoX N-terminal domain-containing protein [Aliiroseovarius halocynthiae]|uniref:TfoX/Sxy family protein n=1 Tax=Aliiroseovarius halocynthiae TaxID=985055 RepID=A0A545SW06_9RHOB|nr:TfoX/Sxy family protein [Aliiroseovarius halocynthiae]TQV69145.1 TfoX/Sxy family protein [Aliiroseovarius halocynthiae]SMR71903.1 TfoX N-terminal domain-containing protein [Aliiroseovarius halocynthiae]